jgi:hypothetical protein
MSKVKNSYPKLHSYKLKGAEKIEQFPNYSRREEDNPYIVLHELIKKEGLTSVSIAYWCGDEFNYRTNHNKISGAIYDFNVGINKAMGVLK